MGNEGTAYDIAASLDALFYKLPGMPEFYDELKQVALMHLRKQHDYTGVFDDPLFNFKQTAAFSRCNLKQVFRQHIGTKIARLLTLDTLEDDHFNECALNESIEDTLRDLASYCLLEAAARQRLDKTFLDVVVSTAVQTPQE